ncbi:translesion DNA synthesis-associated protein ImuA [Aliikangiella marina]|uniref:Translesion DNA synthesis-associated protein ImuA n=1 Tax=Aliikangiella marina TaxID=1712262 RepID=A0A545TJA6_9GAMM|nr:translesion DNA synthesis-associated protein ImuA [Aliikangiella marina]TQV77312.1 translesion DNA synthesis-associated protein ImuA [Aliikangiella marina]
MSRSTAVSQLLKNQAIWQAGSNSSSTRTLSTGYQQLDEILHLGGWPQGAVSELLLSQNGIGEIRLLSPLLAKLNRQPGYITWINPPYEPYPPALAKHQLDLNRIIVVRTQKVVDTVWAAQQALASNACSAVLTWLPNNNLNKAIRKLNLAAKTGNCWGFIFRSQQFHQQASAAPLRILMASEQRHQKLSIIKQPGGWSGQELTLKLFPERQYWNALSVNHWPSYQPSSSGTSQIGIQSPQSDNSHDEISLPSYH